MDIIALHGGTILEVHEPVLCAGEVCPIHNPTDHSLRDAPQRWLALLRIMVRVCRHGGWHPDPDDPKVRDLTTFSGLLEVGHDCDGCCIMPPDRGERS
jgi:hypothetical protein